MTEGSSSFLAKFKRPKVLIPTLAGLAAVGGIVCYLILINPNSIFVRWAQAALPARITLITLGPYPEEKDFLRLKKEQVKYIVSTLDPRLPYEKALIERERVLADKYGMVLRVFPMASIFDRKLFPDYLEQQERAADFLKHLDGPAYLHCYLGKHRVKHVRDALVKAGLPERYFTVAASTRDYWELLSRIEEAQSEFDKKNYGRVLEILARVTANDIDVSYLRGWSHYRLGLIDEAMSDFRQGLSVDPANSRNLLGLGYCYLLNGQPVMAQRQFNAILQQSPGNESAWIGLGLAYLKLQNKAEAALTFRKVLEINPSNDEARRYLKQTEGP